MSGLGLAMAVNDDETMPMTGMAVADDETVPMLGLAIPTLEGSSSIGSLSSEVSIGTVERAQELADGDTELYAAAREI